jgi:hypothetical protein
MMSKAKMAIALVALIGSTQLSVGKELDTDICCLHPGGAHRRAIHAQDMRWETHGIRPASTGERHVIERNWQSD